MDRKAHWEEIYAKNKVDELSWYQAEPEFSLRMIEAARLPRDAPILDVGGGASRLADRLIELGYQEVTVLDISRKALDHAKNRLGERAEAVHWREGDILEFQAEKPYSFWHDRAIFHFLTDPDDRRKYLQTLRRSLASPSYVMIAAFAMDGPEKCSGLPIQRYSHESLSQALGGDYRLILKDREIHLTPAGKPQSFIYALFKKEPVNSVL